MNLPKSSQVSKLVDSFIHHGIIEHLQHSCNGNILLCFFCKLFGHTFEHLLDFTVKSPLISILCKPYCYVSYANLLYTHNAVL